MPTEFTYLEAFVNQIDVHCPKCSAHALVISPPQQRETTRCICTHCGFTQCWQGNATLKTNARVFFQMGAIVLGQATDCYFGFSLWYCINFKNETLFAYNISHLEFLENYIANKLRERSSNDAGWSNQSLESRLPRWMLLSKNRAEILKKISVLRNKK